MSELFDTFIRPISPDDELFLWEMLYQAIYIPEGSLALPREIINSQELARYVLYWGQPDDFGLLAVDTATRQPVGAVWLRLFTRDNKGYGFIDDETPELSIAMLPGYRGKGIGTELLSALFATAQTQYKAICLSVSIDNPAARLYQRLGFEVVGKEDTSLIMRKSFGATLLGKPVKSYRLPPQI
jgi:ribosomal protein S18 acetylase RimI-like enzyme